VMLSEAKCFIFLLSNELKSRSVSPPPFSPFLDLHKTYPLFNLYG